jgi:hypothetical protein
MASDISMGQVAAVEAAGGIMRRVDDPIYSGLKQSPWGFGTYIFEFKTNQNPANRAANRAAFLAKIADVDVLIDETSYYYASSPANIDGVLAGFNLATNSNYKFVSNKKIFTLDKTMSAANGVCHRIHHSPHCRFREALNPFITTVSSTIAMSTHQAWTGGSRLSSALTWSSRISPRPSTPSSTRSRATPPSVWGSANNESNASL